MRIYIITEGELEMRFLTRVLPIDLLTATNTKIVAAGGYSAALSLTRSLLLDNVDKVILFLDADTMDKDKAINKLIFISEYFRLDDESKNRLNPILMIPHFESFVFCIPEITKKYFPNLTDTQLTHLKYDPSSYKFKDNLKKVILDLIERMDDNDIKLYWDTSYIEAIIKSLKGIEDD